MLFEIINPSDPYTLEAPDLEIAGVVCLLVGRGQYALEQVDGDATVPLMLFGADSWFEKQFDATAEVVLARTLNDRWLEVADCLDSVLIGKGPDRANYFKALELIADPDKRQEWRDHWHDVRRSSMNDIGKYAYGLAKSIRTSKAS